MSRTAEPMAQNTFQQESSFNGSRHIPILPSSTTSTNFSQSEMMETTPPASAAMGPPATSSPEAELEGPQANGGVGMTNANGNQGELTPTTNGTNGNTSSAAAAATSQQGRVIQTAFIHKLYK